MAIRISNHSSLKDEKRIMIKEKSVQKNYFDMFDMYISANWISKVFRHSYKHLECNQYNNEIMFEIRNAEDIIYITIPILMQNGKVAISAVFISPDNIPQSNTFVGYKTWNTDKDGSEKVTPDQAWKMNLDIALDKLADKIEEFKHYEGG